MRAWMLVALTGCAVGTPPGFSKGESWSFPLVGPLEDDLLLVPVLVENLPEPVLFMIDPDSAISSIDNALQKQLQPYSRQVPHELNERDQRVPVFVAEIKKIKIGELEVDNLRMRVHKAGTFWAGGRLVRGILGRDVMADSLLFYADRDRGIGMLATQDSLSPPPQAAEIHFRNYFHRHVAKVKINGRHELDMHLDLGARTTMLWDTAIQKAGLPKLAVRAELQDEYGTTWQESSGGLAAMVETGGARVDAVVVLPYGDRRVDKQDLDGALGQNFFSRFNVMVNWHEKTFWLKRRTTDLVGTSGERLRRWGRAFVGCARPACVKIELVRGQGEPPASPPAGAPGASAPGASAPAGAAAGAGAPAGTAAGAAAGAGVRPGAAAQPAAPAGAATGAAQPGASAQPAAPAGAGAAAGAGAQPGAAAQPAAPAPPPGTAALQEIRIAREPRASGATYEVLLDAVSESGESLGLPRLRATLKADSETLVERDLAPDYAAAATFLVLDASPFPRECDRLEGGERCVWQQAAR